MADSTAGAGKIQGKSGTLKPESKKVLKKNTTKNERDILKRHRRLLEIWDGLRIKTIPSNFE